ncbi:MAG: zinc-dependent peptidase [Halomonadaceae bacterium]|nr:MAG: zinc-dependent peptidase [Halomonadaceae bacterium]
MRRRRERRIIQGSDLGQPEWAGLCHSQRVLHRLSNKERERLRQLVILFLHDKQIVAMEGLELNRYMRWVIAAQACLPILNLGLDWYRGWQTIMVYPNAFEARHEYMDEAGVVHEERGLQAGEAWDQGPVVLAWEEVRHSSSLVIHEFAHKLDARNGVANGMPPLHPEMDRSEWTRVFAWAWKDFVARVDAGEAVPIDPYAAEAPAEFFAVLSETFFEAPGQIRYFYPDVYEQLRQFYRQDLLV